MPDLENLLDQPIIYRTWLQVVSRIAPGATAAQAVAQLEPDVNQEVPTANKFGGPPLPRRTIAGRTCGHRDFGIAPASSRSRSSF